MSEKSYTDLLNEGIDSRTHIDDLADVNGTRTAASEVSKACADLGQSLAKVGDTLSKVADVAVVGAMCVAGVYLAKSISNVTRSVREKRHYRRVRDSAKRYLLSGKEEAVDVVDYTVR